MYLTQFSDYAMRVVLYLGCHPEHRVSVGEISQAYGISQNHLVKVVQTLTELGIVLSQRGRGGGMQLAKPPSEINIGWLIRQAEPHFNLVECFDMNTNTCPIAPDCRLKGALHRARDAFLSVLDSYSLDQFLTPPSRLASLLEASSGHRTGIDRAAGIDRPTKSSSER